MKDGRLIRKKIIGYINTFTRKKSTIFETKSRKLYFAGGLFTNKDLIGNMFLASSIEKLSYGKYRCVLPQDLQQMNTSTEGIKDQDLINVRDTDGILVSFDGTELDSGTVVEFIASKFLNKPAVIYRTDFRAGGDQDMRTNSENWNLMLTNYPRTEVVNPN